MASSHGTTKHGTDCGCVRCTGFQPGHDLATRHGAYSKRALTERAAELEPDLRADFQGAVDDALLGVVASAQAQVMIGFEALERIGDTPDARLKYIKLSEDVRGWCRLLLRVLDKCAATPQARAEVASRLARAGYDMRLAPDERAEYERLEAQAVNGDLLALPDIKDRVKLRSLRRKVSGE